ncbi:hypothetical protein KBZ15_17655 [Cyanobium sp. BA20m-p-22]|uniref:hypothetical protein n=1 Tax=Cyanobium sp. BA20m-p-22 TaxID=2823704 RepID=UPI0020CE6F44|nr:hypothetical protein [Cyanobium sp. BA20m-p-22]MCP9911713.1 hypothetical protein [Cyanobium sp. BA20m-p-22]
MNINQLTPSDAKRFQSAHSLHFQGAGNIILIQLCGVVVVDYEAKGSMAGSRGWANETLSLNLALPAVPGQSQSFFVEQSTPLITINGVGGISTVGWSVNSCTGPVNTLCNGSYGLEAVLGVYTSGEVLHTIGYMVSLVGHFQA